MTDKEYENIEQTKSEIDRLEKILDYMSKTWKNGFLIRSEGWKFNTSYGGLQADITLEKDEFDAITSYLKSKLKKLKEIFDNL